MNYNINLESSKGNIRKRRKKPSILSIISLSALCLCFFISILATTKMFVASSKQSNLLKEIDSLSSSNNSILAENVKLEKELSEKQSTYDKAMSQKKIAHLTFDDGPSSNTLELLDVLDKYNAKATFFVIYKEGFDDIYREIVNRGHVLANHTYSHNYQKIYSSTKAFISDVEALDNKLKEITGKEPSKILRFPGGSNTGYMSEHKNMPNCIFKALKDRGYTYFDWNVDSSDATKVTLDEKSIIKSVLDGSSNVNTANILMHDTNFKYTTLDAMPKILEGLKAQGYVFRPLNHNSADIRFIN
ncbi:polysaccharide deacetylase family protein [Clostridium sulfidigenes]|uniref:polysaccharide deacetylase family protein n=1 Tax=Clostridium sulfidigenes TaxID=318464 RepID=UPI003F8BE450